ncbi:MAG: hypothetical protein IMY88_04585 [Chloroflexi bacterium]|nr:hypothetical protein [Chloroflexota bacterium]
MIKSILVRIGIVLIGILVVILGRGFFYYSGFYQAPPSKLPSYEYVAVPAAPSTEFSDVYEKGEGIILVDLAHDNAFDKEELNVLILRLVSRGLTIKFFNPGDDLKRELLGKVEEEEPLVKEEEEPLGEEEEEPLVEEEEELPRADAFIVVCPQWEFSKEEGETIDEFVNNGGKLLLIADPTRSSQINSISLQFGLIFEAGYLYNMKENEINYRNIFVAEFKETEITKNIEKIALYTAGSISSADCGIAFVDQNTFSSLIETRQKLSPIAQTQESKVLAIYDLTFMTEPYNGILDNNQLIANIADWLMFTAEGAGSK